jgi:hypothetical protein
MVVSLVGLLLPPFPRDQRYHQLADQRILLGMPNFWNVVSNPPIIAIGAVGLWPAAAMNCGWLGANPVPDEILYRHRRRRPNPIKM